MSKKPRNPRKSSTPDKVVSSVLAVGAALGLGWAVTYKVDTVAQSQKTQQAALTAEANKLLAERKQLDAYRARLISASKKSSAVPAPVTVIKTVVGTPTTVTKAS